MFINYKDNSYLDKQGSTPVAKVTKGMKFVDQIYNCGEAPSQGRMNNEGNAYADREFPNLSYIIKAEEIKEAPVAIVAPKRVEPVANGNVAATDVLEPQGS